MTTLPESKTLVTFLLARIEERLAAIRETDLAAPADDYLEEALTAVTAARVAIEDKNDA